MSETPRGLAAITPGHEERFYHQLRTLKKGVGLTPESASGGVLRFLQYFGATTGTAAYSLLRSALDSMDPAHLHVQALLNAYGSKGLPDNIKSRRSLFAEKHGETEARVLRMEDRALLEMVEILDAHAQGKEIVTPKIKTVDSAEEPSIKGLLLGLTKAIQEQTAVLRQISAKLDRK